MTPTNILPDQTHNEDKSRMLVCLACYALSFAPGRLLLVPASTTVLAPTILVIPLQGMGGLWRAGNASIAYYYRRVLQHQQDQWPGGSEGFNYLEGGWRIHPLSPEMPKKRRQRKFFRPNKKESGNREQPKPAQCLATTPKNTQETTRNCSIHRQERNRKRLRKGRAKRRSKQLSGSPSAVRESIVSGRRWLPASPDPISWLALRSTLWSPRPWLCVARTPPTSTNLARTGERTGLFGPWPFFPV